MPEKYRIKGGNKKYENFFNVLKVAEAKAKEEESPITIQKELLNTFEDVTKVHPSGKREDLENQPDM